MTPRCIPSPQSEPTGAVVEAVQQAGPKARYFRFQPQVRGVGMIETDEARLCEMEARVRASFRKSIEAREVCRLIARSAASSRRRLPLSLARASRASEAWARAALERAVLAHAAHRCRPARGTALQSLAQGWALWAFAQQVLLAWGRLVGLLLGSSLAVRRAIAAGLYFCLLLTAYCLLLAAYCLLLTAYCLLLTSYLLPLTSLSTTHYFLLLFTGAACHRRGAMQIGLVLRGVVVARRHLL